MEKQIDTHKQVFDDSQTRQDFFDYLQATYPDNIEIKVARAFLYEDLLNYQTSKLLVGKAHIIYQKYLYDPQFDDDRPQFYADVPQDMVNHIRSIIWKSDDGDDPDNLITNTFFANVFDWLYPEVSKYIEEFLETIKQTKIKDESKKSRNRNGLIRARSKNSMTSPKNRKKLKRSVISKEQNNHTDLSNNTLDWSINDVSIWLKKNHYKKYNHTFKKNLIDGNCLLEINTDDLIDLNIDPTDVAPLMKKIKRLKNKDVNIISHYRVDEWTAKDVGMWLCLVGFDKYKTTFIDNAISGSVLLDLDKQDLLDMKVASCDIGTLMQKLIILGDIVKHNKS